MRPLTKTCVQSGGGGGKQRSNSTGAGYKRFCNHFMGSAVKIATPSRIRAVVLEDLGHGEPILLEHGHREDLIRNSRSQGTPLFGRKILVLLVLRNSLVRRDCFRHTENGCKHFKDDPAIQNPEEIPD